MQRFWGDKANI